MSFVHFYVYTLFRVIIAFLLIRLHKNESKVIIFISMPLFL